MIESLKKMDKKFLVTAGLFVFVPIVIIIILAIIQGCANLKTTYPKYEKKMISAAEKYFKSTNKLPKKENNVESVSLSKLVSSEYIKSPEKLLGDNSCKGQVYVRLNGSQIEENNGGFYNYTVNLTCKKHKTNSLKNLVLKDLTTKESGLYEENGEYIFKGDIPNNYITIKDKIYRIMSIDSDGMAKLIRTEPETLDKYWDIKYNSEVLNSYGKNIYKDSNILKELRKDYLTKRKIDPTIRQHIVSQNVCVGHRDINDISISSSTECSEVLKYQPLSLIGVTDFAKASLDKECNSINSKSCRNYNYLKYLDLDTWTYVAVSNNTYEVYYLSNGVIDYQEASSYGSYNFVFKIDSMEFVKSGNGRELTPYLIEFD